MQKTTAFEVYSVADAMLDGILEDPDGHAVKAQLAQLRRGLGKKPGEVPETMGILLQAMPEKMYGRREMPSKEEWAIYTALTLFALHQQGYDPSSSPMHRQKEFFAAGMARLVQNDDDLERIRRRLNRILSASDIAELASHLRFVVPMLREAGIPADYSLLALDLYYFQTGEEAAQEIRLRWGQNFYAQLKRQGKADKNKTVTASDPEMSDVQIEE